MVNHSFIPCSDECREQVSEQQKLLNLSLDVICTVDGEGRFRQVTAAAKTVWGYDPEELVGRNYIDLVLPEDRDSTLAVAGAVISGFDVTNFQNRYIRKDGSAVPVFWSARWDKATQTMYSVARDATEKEAAEKKKLEYEQKLYRAYRLAKISWWEWDEVNGKYSISDELFEAYGLDKSKHAAFTRELFFSLIHPDDLAHVKTAVAACRRQQYSQIEHRMIRPDGEIIYIIHYIETERDAEGNVLRIHGTTKNISERKTAELALKRSEHRLAQILESIGDGFFAVDQNWVVTYWNRQAEAVLQRKREEMLGKNLWDEYQEAIPLKFYSESHRAVAENKPVHFEEFFPPLQMWIEASAYPSAEGLSVYFKDVTSRKLQQDALKESNQRYGYVTKATSDAIWDWDLATGTIEWGEGFEANFGHRLASRKSHIDGWAEKVHPDDIRRVREGLFAVIGGTETNWSDEYRFRKTDGSYAFVLDKGFVIRDETGTAVRMVGSMQDISRQKEAEQSIRLSEEQFKLLFYLSPKPKWMVDTRTWRFVEVNQAAITLYGYSKEEFLQLTVPELKVESELWEWYDLCNREGSKFDGVVHHRKKNGEVLPIEISSHAIDLPGGRHYIVSGDDLTEKLRLQQTLIDEKIAAQKEVAKAILDTQERERSEIGKELHDNVNQLLTTAKLYIENINYFPEQKEAFIDKGVSLLQKSIQEIRALSKQLVTPVMADIGFEETIDELISHYRSVHLFEIEWHYCICEKLLDKGLKLTIYRIVQEQLNNIVKYANASLVKVSLVEQEKELKLMISDNGVGFDLSKSSKGLGLKNLRNRAEVFKGSVHIHSVIGAGSQITVCFPVQTNEGFPG